MRQLLRRGLPFYAANLLASLIFYPLLLKVATGNGLSDIGYLRVGQILQQLFAFLPATLVPVLFLRMRGESTFSDQVQLMEKPLRLIWLLLLEVLLLYCVFDKFAIIWLFGPGYASALLPTRLLLITALFECLAQLVIQPFLAAGQIRMYGIWQNGAAVLAAVLGWFLIPSAGLPAYLFVRFLYVLLPLIGFSIPVFKQLYEPRKILFPTLVTIVLSVLFLHQIFQGYESSWTPSAALVVFIGILILQRQDLLLFKRAMWKA